MEPLTTSHFSGLYCVASLSLYLQETESPTLSYFDAPQLMAIQSGEQGLAVLSCDMLPLQKKNSDLQAQVCYGIEYVLST